jgi:Flp pilus assembly protein TadG
MLRRILRKGVQATCRRPSAALRALADASAGPTMRPVRPDSRSRVGLNPFCRDRTGAAAVEFALVAAPFVMLLLGLLQMGLYFVAQSALDSGVTTTAETLRNNFTTGSSPTLLTAAQLKASVAAAGLIANDSTTAVEIRQLTALDSAATPIADGTVDYGSTTSVLVLRAQAQVLNFAPGLSGLAQIQSSAIIRRQGT